MGREDEDDWMIRKVMGKKIEVKMICRKVRKLSGIISAQALRMRLMRRRAMIALISLLWSFRSLRKR